jgi:hypothetical protein
MSFLRMHCFNNEVYQNAFHIDSKEAMTEYVNIEFLIKLVE